MTIKMIATVTAECEVRTLGDLRKLIEWCDKYRISDGRELDWAAGKVYLDVADGASGVQWIECGDHIPPNHVHDVLVVTHHHE